MKQNETSKTCRVMKRVGAEILVVYCSDPPEDGIAAVAD